MGKGLSPVGRNGVGGYSLQGEGGCGLLNWMLVTAWRTGGDGLLEADPRINRECITYQGEMSI